MKPYGLKREWNATEEMAKNGKAYRPSAHRKDVKLLHRSARRVVRYLLHILQKEAL